MQRDSTAGGGGGGGGGGGIRTDSAHPPPPRHGPIIFPSFGRIEPLCASKTWCELSFVNRSHKGRVDVCDLLITNL